MENREYTREYTREEFEDYLNKTEEMNNNIQAEINRVRAELKDLDEKEAQKAFEAELDPTAGVDIPDDYVYVLLEQNDLQIHNIGEDICFECAEDLSRLGLIRNTADSAWVSARRNIRANRLEALAHSIGGAYEFEFGEDNYYVYVDDFGIFAKHCISSPLEPEKIYMTKDTAEKVCEILNSGRYKLNVDVAVEDDEFCEEGCCDACAGNDY